MPTTPLGDYLRARRALVRPEAAGIPSGGLRRVPGLRREEVAMRAEMSVDYYTRLEQGRERSPSAQVLDALSRVLRLDDDARLHLYRVAGLTPGGRGSGASERVDPQLRSLMELWARTPAIVLGRAYDVLTVNQAGVPASRPAGRRDRPPLRDAEPPVVKLSPEDADGSAPPREPLRPGRR